MTTRYGTPQNDTMHGSEQNDYLWADNGNDKLFGYGGDDVLIGVWGRDTIDGGAGNDVIYLGHPSSFGRGYSELTGNLAFGGLGRDFIVGDAGNDTIYGGGGNDAIYGFRGNDQLKGDAGDDVISSNSDSRSNGLHYGVDTMTGGAGRDIFTFSGNEHRDRSHGVAILVKEAGIGGAVITDFAHGHDRIDLKWFHTGFWKLDIAYTDGDAHVHAKLGGLDGGTAVLNLTVLDTVLTASDFIF